MEPISPVIQRAVEIMRLAFGGTKVEIIGTEMYRTPPDEFAPGGRPGMDIEIEGIKVFLEYTLAEDILVYGIHVAETMVYKILDTKYDFKEMFKNQENGQSS